MDYLLNRLIALVVSGVIAYITYRLNEKAISKGNYIEGWGRAKYTLWSLPFYFSCIFFLVFACVFLGIF